MPHPDEAAPIVDLLDDVFIQELQHIADTASGPDKKVRQILAMVHNVNRVAGLHGQLSQDDGDQVVITVDGRPAATSWQPQPGEAVILVPVANLLGLDPD